VSIAVDSNIVIYAEGLNDERRQDLAAALLDTIGRENLLIPVQVLGEVFVALVRHASHSRQTAASRISEWLVAHEVQETNREIISDAIELVRRHGLQVWDAVIVSAAEFAGATYLLSEDMQDGFRWRGLTVVNPFFGDPAELIQRLTNATKH